MLKILQLSDLHILPAADDTMLGIATEFYFARVLSEAHQQHGRFDLIILSGDLAQDPCPASYQRILQHLHPYQTPTLCLPGNHDDAQLMQGILQDDWVSCAKHLLVGGWHFIALNSQKLGSPVGYLIADELILLRQLLAEHPDIPTLVAVHHPCVASGSVWLDTMQIENSAEFLAILAEYPQVKAVTCGHVHQELATERHGIKIFAAPASCFQFTPLSSEFSIADTSPGYRIFQLFADGRLASSCHRITDSLDKLDREAHGY